MSVTAKVIDNPSTKLTALTLHFMATHLLSGLSRRRDGSHDHTSDVFWYGRRVLSLTGTSDRTWHAGSHCRLAGPPCAQTLLLQWVDAPVLEARYSCCTI